MLSGGLVGVALILHVVSLAVISAVRPLTHARSFALRQAVLHVVRPGNQTRVILLAVGLGTFFILAVRSLQANLLEDFAVQVGFAALGVGEAVVQAILDRAPVTGATEDQMIAINLARELTRNHKLSDASFDAARKRLGDAGVVDFEDWEAQTAARDVVFLWPNGDELDARAEGYIDDYHFLAPTGSLDLQVMYITITDGAVAPFSVTAMLKNP